MMMIAVNYDSRIEREIGGAAPSSVMRMGVPGVDGAYGGVALATTGHALRPAARYLKVLQHTTHTIRLLLRGMRSEFSMD